MPRDLLTINVKFDDDKFREYLEKANLVEVIWCKDCKYSYSNVSGIYCRQHSVEVEPDFYCGDGEDGDI